VYKRAANLAREGEGGEARAELFETDYEMALYKALPQARAGIEALLARADEVLVPWDLGRGPAQALGGLELKGILALKGPLDAFLDHVLVMVEDPLIRRNRLALLTQVRDALRGLGALELLEGA
jgi:glycyl-tRNA synthetase beta chain